MNDVERAREDRRIVNAMLNAIEKNIRPGRSYVGEGDLDNGTPCAVVFYAVDVDAKKYYQVAVARRDNPGTALTALFMQEAKRRGYHTRPPDYHRIVGSGTEIAVPEWNETPGAASEGNAAPPPETGDR